MRRLGATAARAAVLTAVAAVVAGVAAGPAGAAPARAAGPAAFPGKPGRIAFVRDGDIFTIEPDGAGLAKLTGDGQASGPRWSPDGGMIAYLDAGNLWVMNADGSHKTRLTDAAPGFTDSRPTWSSNGQYLVFVKTARHAAFGYLTRYNLATKGQAGYTDTINGHLVDVAALPAPVAWTQASNGGYYIAFEGAAAQCPAPLRHCLSLLGLSTQAQFMNGFPSSEYSDATNVRLTGPDWYPLRTLYDLDIIATSENCTSGGHCTVSGTEWRLTKLVLPGSYEAVFNPEGTALAYVKNTNGAPLIYTVPTSIEGPYGTPAPLAQGTEPDWQPLPL